MKKLLKGETIKKTTNRKYDGKILRIGVVVEVRAETEFFENLSLRLGIRKTYYDHPLDRGHFVQERT